MSTLDQSFSSSNFHVIFNLLNRRGKIDVTKLSAAYQKAIADIKDVRSKISKLRKKKKSEWTEEDKDNLEEWNLELDKLYKEKKDQLDHNMVELSEKVNSPHFRMTMTHHTYKDHNEFTLDTSSIATQFAISQLLHNLKRTFNIKMYDRHTIMTALRSLLNSKMPLYLIRTDASKFFESIPQDRLISKIDNSALLSYKSRAFIKGILKEFEKIKDEKGITSIPKGKGVPRGVGISSMLSEIYMQDIDRKLRNRKETMFYVRYVDDIILLVRSIGKCKDINEYYNGICDFFLEYGLSLKPIGDAKCQLIDLVKSSDRHNFDYLGYKIFIDPSSKDEYVKFDLSSKKHQKIKSRIDKAFIHFEDYSKVNIKGARRDLLNALNLITGNIRLKNAKSGVKAGLFYSNDLLTKFESINSLNSYLHHKELKPYRSAFVSEEEYIDFKNKLKSKIDKINMNDRWKERKMYEFPISRILEIQKWL